MTKWATETDMLEPETFSREPAAEYTPLSLTRDEQIVHEDQRWMAYVARLAPDDRRAAFLLLDELPDAQSRPRQIRGAIEMAMRRAFASQHFRIDDYELGTIQGDMHVLLPQGKEMHYYFDNELGWKATATVSSDSEEYAFPLYLREVCMNPLRRAVLHGKIDTSEVRFTPLDGGEIQRIAANPELDRMTARALKRLYGQYLTLSGQNP